MEEASLSLSLSVCVCVWRKKERDEEDGSGCSVINYIHRARDSTIADGGSHPRTLECCRNAAIQ